MANYLKQYGIENNAEGNLNANIGAGATSLVLETGDGAVFPVSLNGTATSGGDVDTLNSTGIQAAGVLAGDTIYNHTDGSWAVVESVSTNAVETTPLQGGSGNTWDNSDVWVVNPFVITLVQYNTVNTPSSGVAKRERVFVRRTAASDTLTVLTRGHDGDTAQSFNAGDNVYLFVESSQIEAIFAGLKDNLVRMVAAEALYLAKDGTVALNNNTNFIARNNANSANVNLFKLTTGDVLEFQTLPRNPSSRSISNSYDLTDKLYVDAQVSGLSVVLGETVTIGQALYIKASDSKAYKTTAATSGATIESFIGWAAAGGSANDTIAVDRTISGNQSGLTAGSFYYLSDTAGAISTTAGTNQKLVGLAVTATVIIAVNFTRVASGTIGTIAEDVSSTTQVTTGFRPSRLFVQGVSQSFCCNSAGANCQSLVILWWLEIVNGFAVGHYFSEGSATGSFPSLSASATPSQISSATIDASRTDLDPDGTITNTIAFALTDTGFSYTVNTTYAGTAADVQSSAQITSIRWTAIA